MGVRGHRRGRRTRQAVRIRTRNIQRDGGGVRRESRVKYAAPAAEPTDGIKLGVRIVDRQRITEFYLNGVDVRTLPRNPEAERELNELPRFALEGEHWIVWNVSSAQLPPSSGFDTSFALSPAYPDGQTVMWAVAYAAESYADDHVYVGYADVTRPERAGRRRRGR